VEDKEVGELWDLYRPDGKGSVVDLIRKLVEERAHAIAANYYRIYNPDNIDVKSCIAAACRDFGIDPATWGAKIVDNLNSYHYRL